VRHVDGSYQLCSRRDGPGTESIQCGNAILAIVTITNFSRLKFHLILLWPPPFRHPIVNDQPSVYDILCGDAAIDDARCWVNERLAVVPSNLDLAAAEMELAGEVGREVILRDKLEVDPEEFDYMILDCPPSLGVLTINALTAVDEVFLPLQPHFLALHGLSKLLKTIEIVAKRLNPSLHLSGVVLCMYESSTRLAAEVTRDVDEFLEHQSRAEGVWSGAKFFQTRIRRNIRLAEAPSFGQSILEYAPTSNGAEDYRALARELVELHLGIRHTSAQNSRSTVSRDMTVKAA
jgi:chromosome partitioning protein